MISDKEKQRMMRLFFKLVSMRSDTCTPMEKDIEKYIYDWLAGLSYFKKNEQFVGCEPIPNDPLKRVAVWALVRGSGSKTMVLLNHHDTVLPTNYGALAKYAHDPIALADQMQGLELSDDIRRDLESGDWIFGRGTADMKAGAVLQMALIQEFSEKMDFHGNLLFLSVPGEEYMSAGMLSSVGLMERLQEQYGLDYRLLIDCEPHQRDEDDIGVLYEGSAGKLLAMVYVRGKKAHVGNVFAGYNPLLLLSEIILQTELNTDFCDVVEQEVAPPPTWMFMEDRQMQYEGTVPEAAAGCLSLISLNSKLSQINARLMAAIHAACGNVAQKIEQQLKRFNSMGITFEQTSAWNVKISHFEDIFACAKDQCGQEFLDDYHRTQQEISRSIDANQESIQNGSHQLIEKVLSYIPDRSPIVVLAYLPPFYPSAANSTYPALSKAAASIGKSVDAFSRKKWGKGYKALNYFMQISDMSFASFHDMEEAVATIGRNMPLWDKFYGHVFCSGRFLSMPVVNIGPWGKDLHKIGERVYRPDLEERTYAILKHVIQQVFVEK